MATKQMAYDHPTYTARRGEAVSEAGGAATTAYSKYVAFTAQRAFSAQMTVTTAGTAAGHGLVVQRIRGTATTALGTQTLGTAALGATFNLLLTTAAGGVDLAKGDILQASTLADATGRVAIA